MLCFGTWLQICFTQTQLSVLQLISLKRKSNQKLQKRVAGSAWSGGNPSGPLCAIYSIKLVRYNPASHSSSFIGFKCIDVYGRTTAKLKEQLAFARGQSQMSERVRTREAGLFPAEDHSEDLDRMESNSHALFVNQIPPAQSPFNLPGVMVSTFDWGTISVIHNYEAVRNFQ